MQVPEVALVLAVACLLGIQFLGMEFASQNGSPRGYYIMSTILGLLVGIVVLVFVPQLGVGL